MEREGPRIANMSADLTCGSRLCGAGATSGSGGGGAAKTVVDSEAEAGGRDWGDGDAAGTGFGCEVVDVVEHGEKVGGGLGEIASGREIEAGAEGVDWTEAEPDLVRTGTGGVEAKSGVGRVMRCELARGGDVAGGGGIERSP